MFSFALIESLELAGFPTKDDMPKPYSGMIAECTGVIPPNVPKPPACPPQNALPAAERRGEVGRSLAVLTLRNLLLDELPWVFADIDVARGEMVATGDSGERGAGGGSIGEARPSRMAFLRAVTS